MNTSPQMLTLTQIAARAGVTPSAVSNWRRRHNDFPTPDSNDLYSAHDVDTWLLVNGKTTAMPRSSGLHSMLTFTDYADLAAGRATLATLAHLGISLTGRSGEDIAELGTVMEAEHDLPTGCLSAPLDTLARRDPHVRAALIDEVRGQLTDHTPVQVFDAALQTAGTSDHTSSPALADFLVSLLPDRAGSLLDPACGTGTLLQAAAAHTGATRIDGYDLSQQAWALAVQRLMLHGLPTTGLHRQDVFEAHPQGFDAVVTHPPLGARLRDDSPAAQMLRTQGIYPHQEYAWLLAARNALTDNGTAVVLTTAGAASQKSGAPLRHELVRTGCLKTVITVTAPALGMTTFGVWILGEPTPEPAPVLFINGGADLDKVTRTVHSWRTDPDTFTGEPGFATTTAVLPLLADTVDLDPARATATPIDAGQALHDATTATTTLATAWQALHDTDAAPPALHLHPGHTPLVGLLEVAEVTRPAHITRDHVHDHGEHPYVTGVGDQPRIGGYLTELPDKAVTTEPGDIIMSSIGTVRAIVDHTGGHTLSSSVWRVRPTGALRDHPDVLALLLTSARIQAQTSGTTVRRLRHPKDVTVALPDPDTLHTLDQWAATLNAARHHAQDYLHAVRNAEHAVVNALDAGATTSTGDAKHDTRPSTPQPGGTHAHR